MFLNLCIKLIGKKKVIMDKNNNAVDPQHIGDGLYMIDKGNNVAIAVNSHTAEVAFIDNNDIDRAIAYLTSVKERIKTN
jgi:hypothetical protein